MASMMGYAEQAADVMTRSQAGPSATGINTFTLGAGLTASILGMFGAAVGSFYQAKTAQYQMRSQASAQRFQARMASLNASRLETQAQSLLDVGAQQVGQYTARAGQERARAEVGVAARGLQAGVGSTRDLMATLDYAREADKYVISANAVRAAEAARMQRVDVQNQAAMAQLSASNLEASAGAISPWGMFATSLMGSAASVAPQWAMLARKY